jgi:hypothetical protein
LFTAELLSWHLRPLLGRRFFAASLLAACSLPRASPVYSPPGAAQQAAWRRVSASRIVDVLDASGARYFDVLVSYALGP